MMTFKEFDEFWEKKMAGVKALEEVKRGEYNEGLARFDQFYKEAEEAGVHPFVVWKIYFSKHYRSLMTYIKDVQTQSLRPLSESIDGRIMDMIVYLMIQWAMIEEEREKTKKALDSFEPVPNPPSDVTMEELKKYLVKLKTDTTDKGDKIEINFPQKPENP